MMTLADSAEGRHALLQNAGTMFHVKRLMMGQDDGVCSDASLLYLTLQEQADGRSSSIALPRAICKLSLQLTGVGGRDAKRWVSGGGQGCGSCWFGAGAAVCRWRCCFDNVACRYAAMALGGIAKEQEGAEAISKVRCVYLRVCVCLRAHVTRTLQLPFVLRAINRVPRDDPEVRQCART